MTSLPLTKSNLKKFMNAYSEKMESKHQTPSMVSFGSRSNFSHKSGRGGKKKPRKQRGFGNKKTRVDHRKMTAMIQAIKPAVLRRAQIADFDVSHYKATGVKRHVLKIMKDGYFSAIKDQKEDLKSLQNELDLLEKEIQFLKGTLAEAYRGKAMRVKLWYGTARASSANTALTAVETLDPNSSTEMSSLSALFDLCICGGVEIHTAVYTTTGGTASTTITWAVAYDPLSSGVFTGSPAAVLPSAYHLGPIRTGAINPTVTFVFLNDPTTTRTGFHKWHVHIPEEPESNIQSGSSGTGIFTGEWTDTTFGTQINGYLKPFVPAGGASVITQIEHYIGLDMRFKMRS